MRIISFWVWEEGGTREIRKCLLLILRAAGLPDAFCGDGDDIIGASSFSKILSWLYFRIKKEKARKGIEEGVSTGSELYTRNDG